MTEMDHLEELVRYCFQMQTGQLEEAANHRLFATRGDLPEPDAAYFHRLSEAHYVSAERWMNWGTALRHLIDSSKTPPPANGG